MADVNSGSNGIRVSIENLQREIGRIGITMGKLEDRVHSLEVHGCTYKGQHQRGLEEFWSTLKEHKKEVANKMQKQQDQLDKIGQTVAKWAGMAGVVIAVFYIILTHVIRTL
jgi:hypothetical protein